MALSPGTEVVPRAPLIGLAPGNTSSCSSYPPRGSPSGLAERSGGRLALPAAQEGAYVPAAPSVVPQPELGVRSPPQPTGACAVFPGCDSPEQVGALPPLPPPSGTHLGPVTGWDGCRIMPRSPSKPLPPTRLLKSQKKN